MVLGPSGVLGGDRQPDAPKGPRMCCGGGQHLGQPGHSPTPLLLSTWLRGSPRLEGTGLRRPLSLASWTAVSHLLPGRLPATSPPARSCCLTAVLAGADKSAQRGSGPSCDPPDPSAAGPSPMKRARDREPGSCPLRLRRCPPAPSLSFPGSLRC